MQPATIQYGLKLLKLKQTDLARLYNVSNAKIHQVIQGTSPDTELRDKIIAMIRPALQQAKVA